MILGIQAASIGGVPALIANVAEIVWSMMYMKLIARPAPRYIPMPPLRFLDDSEAPIIVSIKEANEDAMRLWYSTWYCTTLLEPLFICLEI